MTTWAVHAQSKFCHYTGIPSCCVAQTQDHSDNVHFLCLFFYCGYQNSILLLLAHGLSRGFPVVFTCTVWQNENRLHYTGLNAAFCNGENQNGRLQFLRNLAGMY